MSGEKRYNKAKVHQFFAISIIGMVLVFGVLVAMVSVPASAVVVDFADSGLEAAIRDAIGKPTGDIHNTDLIGLMSLDANNRGIVNLEGIQYCVDLTELSLSKNQIVDINTLSGLTNLTSLWLYGNEIVNISVLSGLTNLTGLNLAVNQIVDISALSGLTNLKTLWLGGNQIVDISVLSDLTNLTGLYLGDNQVVDISVLSGLTGLTKLYLYDNEIVDISALSSLTNLTWLYLSSNQIADISPLSGLTNLTWLELRGNQISDIAPLVNNAGIDNDDDVVLLNNFLTLALGSPDMLDIEALQRRGVKVEFDPQNPTPPSAVVNFPDPGLEAAIRSAIKKPTGDIHDTDLITLIFLDASGRGIANLEGIQYCVGLVELYMHGNKIVDISALSNLTNLTHLWLSDNRIIDISALAGLTKLTRLWLNGNEIVNIQVLVDNAGLGAGDWVNIRYNCLDLTPGSPDKLDIGTLEGRLVAVAYIPQKD